MSIAGERLARSRCWISARHTPTACGSPRRAGQEHRPSPGCPCVLKGSRPGTGARRWREPANPPLAADRRNVGGEAASPPLRGGCVRPERGCGASIADRRPVPQGFTRQPASSDRRTLSEQPQSCALSAPCPGPRHGRGPRGFCAQKPRCRAGVPGPRPLSRLLGVLMETTV